MRLNWMRWFSSRRSVLYLLNANCALRFLATFTPTPMGLLPICVLGCRFQSSHNCAHNEDVMVTCGPAADDVLNANGYANLGCYDTTNGATDTDGDDCRIYNGNENYCAGYDDADFTSNLQCCACGGGRAGPATQPGPAPPDPPTWHLGNPGYSCSVVCEFHRMQCSETAHLSLADNASAVKLAYESANVPCDENLHTACNPGNCEQWGAPYVHQNHDGSLDPSGRTTAECQFGFQAASCSVYPADWNHRRLCGCEADPSIEATLVPPTSRIVFNGVLSTMVGADRNRIANAVTRHFETHDCTVDRVVLSSGSINVTQFFIGNASIIATVAFLGDTLAAVLAAENTTHLYPIAVTLSTGAHAVGRVWTARDALPPVVLPTSPTLLTAPPKTPVADAALTANRCTDTFTDASVEGEQLPRPACSTWCNNQFQGPSFWACGVNTHLGYVLTSSGQLIGYSLTCDCSGCNGCVAASRSDGDDGDALPSPTTVVVAVIAVSAIALLVLALIAMVVMKSKHSAELRRVGIQATAVQPHRELASGSDGLGHHGDVDRAFFPGGHGAFPNSDPSYEPPVYSPSTETVTAAKALGSAAGGDADEREVSTLKEEPEFLRPLDAEDKVSTGSPRRDFDPFEGTVSPIDAMMPKLARRDSALSLPTRERTSVRRVSREQSLPTRERTGVRRTSRERSVKLTNDPFAGADLDV